MSGKHIELFLVDGTPGGLTTAEIIGWTGHVLRGERVQLQKALDREETQRNGVYILLGDDAEAPEGVRAYIGRSESIVRRFRQHESTKAFWDRFIVITTKDYTFTEGHWGYLESRLVNLALQAQRCTLENGNSPQGRRLSEAQRSDMEAFIDQLRIILPVLGVNIIRAASPSEDPAPAAATPESPVFTLTVPSRGVEARAKILDGEFTVLEGSAIVASWDGAGASPSTQRSYATYRSQHQKLLAEKSIRIEEVAETVSAGQRRAGTGNSNVPTRRGILTRSLPFSSPSTAGAIVTGRSCNGRTEWKTAEGQSYGEWESQPSEPSHSTTLPEITEATA